MLDLEILRLKLDIVGDCFIVSSSEFQDLRVNLNYYINAHFTCCFNFLLTLRINIVKTTKLPYYFNQIRMEGFSFLQKVDSIWYFITKEILLSIIIKVCYYNLNSNSVENKTRL